MGIRHDAVVVRKRASSSSLVKEATDQEHYASFCGFLFSEDQDAPALQFPCERTLSERVHEIREGVLDT